MTKVSFGSKEVTGNEIIKPTHPDVLLVVVPPQQEGGVQVLLENKEHVTNILDFKTPGKALYKYVKPPNSNTNKPHSTGPKPAPKPKLKKPQH